MPSTINADNGVSSGSAGLKSTADSSGVLSLQTNGTTALSISTGQVVTLTNALPAGSGGTGLTSFTANGVVYASSTSALATGSSFVFDGTNVGIGTNSPISKFNVNGGIISALDARSVGDYQFLAEGGYNGYSGAISFQSRTSAGGTLVEMARVSADGEAAWNTTASTQNASLRFFTTNNGTASERMRLDSSGNLGLGVTPSAWTSATGLQVQYAAVEGRSALPSYGTFSANGYTQAGTWKYIASDFASRYTQYQSQHIWYTAPSGTAGNTISFTQAMTLDASGRLLINQTSATYGSPLEITSNTSGIGTVVHGRSSDGTGVIAFAANGAATEYARVQSDNTSALIFGTGSSGSARARISATGGFSVGTASDPGAGAIYATGNITAYFSDDRLKTRLGTIENALDKVGQLNGFYYHANETAQALGYEEKREVGVSAQEVQAVLPEVVAPAPVDEQYLTVHYERLVPLLIEAVKELTARVAALEAR